MRLVTRADFDGLICGVLLSEVEPIESVELAHAKDIHDGRIPIDSRDIIANLPYHPNSAMWFDHHSSEADVAQRTRFQGYFGLAPSCASVIYEYYSRFEQIKRYQPIVIEADKIDAARFDLEDIRNPGGWVLLSKTLNIFDREKRFEPTPSYFQRMMQMVATTPLPKIFEDPEVQRRIAFIKEEQEQYIHTIERVSWTEANVIITDLRNIDYLPNGDKFLVYTLYPQQNVSLQIFNKRNTTQTVISAGYNIFNRTCRANIGELMQTFGGGGHYAAGSCRVEQSEADDVLVNIIAHLKEWCPEVH